MDAVSAERDRLVTSGASPRIMTGRSLPGFVSCGQVTWSQEAVPPGWGSPTWVEALSLYLLGGGGTSYLLTAYSAPGGLAGGQAAMAALCTASVWA